MGALEALCCSYWQPVYFFIRRKGYGEEDAKNHTQNFLHQVTSGSMLAKADSAESKFRTYLLRCCVNYLHNRRDFATAQKRGGGAIHVPIDFDEAEECYRREIADQHTPEQAYDQDWAFTLDRQAMDQLITEYAEKGEAAVFETLQPALLDPDSLLSYYVRSHLGRPVRVADLIDEFLEVKSQTTGYHHVLGLRSRLKHQFGREFGERRLSSLKSDELQRWINSRPGSNRTRRNYHGALVTLFEFARDNGHLPKGLPTEIHLVKKPRAEVSPIKIFSPEELKKLIKAALQIKSRALVPLLIQSLAGVRHEELQKIDKKKDRLRWSDVWLNQPVPEIHIRPEVSKVNKERFIPLHPVLISWLRPLWKSGDDAVYGMNSLSQDYRRICKQADMAWKRNGLRKSFNTYDVALTGSIDKTAQSAGNSATIIRRYYRKEISQVGKLAVAWFSLSPRQFRRLFKICLAAIKRQRRSSSTRH
jgi:integrase